jgi:hypothetical protein
VALPQPCHASRLLATRPHGSTSTTPRVRVPQHVAWLVVNYFASCRLVVTYFAHDVRPGASARRAARHAARRRLLHPRHAACRQPRVVSPLDFSSVGHTSSRRAPGHCVSRRDYSSSGLHQLYCAYAVHPDAPSHRSTSRRSVAIAPTVHPVTVARRQQLRLHHASGCLGASRDSSRGSSSTTSTTLRVRVPRHVARLVVNFFAYTARSGASAHHAARRVACRRLLRLAQARTPRVQVAWHVTRLVVWLVVDNFDYIARPGASARRATCHAARRRLLRLRRVSGCLGTSRGSSSTSSPTLRVRVPRHVARLVVWLVVDYFALCRLVRRASRCLGTSRGSSCGSSSTTSPHAGSYTARPGASARRTARRQLLRLRCASGCLGSSRGSSCGSSRRSSSTTSPSPHILVPRHVARLVTRLVIDYFDYAARPSVSAHRAALHATRRQLL